MKKLYTKNIDGKTIIKPRNKIIVETNGMQTINPSEEMILSDGWAEYILPSLSQEELLINAKTLKKKEVESHDSSRRVNEFFVSDIPIWLDKATRAGLMLRFQAELAMGNTNTTLWYEGQEFLLTLESAIQMLYAIEVYASMCYGNTQKHYANIDALTSVEDVQSYDYNIGYPNKLRF
jgi:hypothetical protein